MVNENKTKKTGVPLSFNPKAYDVPTMETRAYLTFPQAIQEIINGERITKGEWLDESTYALLTNGFLTICIKNIFHRWIVSEADMVGEDYYVLPQIVKN